MVTLDTYSKKLDLLIANFDKEFDKALLNKKTEILDINREKQLFDLGIDSEGKRLMPQYSNYTISSKRLNMQPFNRVTLFDQGNFYRGFDFRFQNGKLLIFSRDEKTTDLQDKYGSSIFGIYKNNLNALNYEILLPEINNFINKYI